MKKLLAIVMFGASAVGLFAQGNVTINSYASGAFVRYSNTVTHAYQAGSNSVVAALYYGADAGSVTNMLPGTFGFGSSGAFLGYVVAASGGGIKTIPGPTFTSGSTVYLQIKAWSVGYDSWESAAASGVAGVLVSRNMPIASALLTSTAGSPPPTPNQVQWAPGSSNTNPLIVELIPVPEPSAIALGVLGLAGAYFIRRRK